MRNLVRSFIVAAVGAAIGLQAHTIPGFDHQHHSDSGLSKPMVRNEPPHESETAFEFDGFESGMTSAEIHQRMMKVSDKKPSYNEENGLFTAISLNRSFPMRRYSFVYTPEDPPRMYRMTIVIGELRSVPSVHRRSNIARRATLNALTTKFDRCTGDSLGYECELKDDELEAEAERRIHTAVLKELSLPVVGRD